MALSDEEKRKWQEQFQREVRGEHQKLNEFLEARASEDSEMLKQAELVAMRQAVREQFWKEQGYVKYTDSRGADSWVSQEEYEMRMERRKARARPFQDLIWSDVARQTMMFGIVLAAAIAAGVLLSWFS